MRIDTDRGPVLGHRHDGVHRWLGIPFAAPPTGERRFRAPVPADPWTEPLVADRFGPACPQFTGGPLSGLVPGQDVGPTDEDCLSLNVWSPEPGGRRPVMVWFHGGGFSLGSARQEVYEASILAGDGDVVVVTANYRLGALGYLLPPDDQPGNGDANVGVLDQVAALAWVRDNIAGFGGDPDRVTVFGESAGGGSVLSLMISPRASGLFHRAIVSSGASDQFPARPAAARVAAVFLEQAGARSLDDLRSRSVDELLDAQGATGAAVLAEVGVMPFAPTADGTVLPASWEDAIAAGAGDDVALVIGTTRDEMRLFATFDPTAADLDAEALAARIRAVGGDDGVVHAYRDEGADWNQVQTDTALWLPAVRIAETRAGRGAPTWMYRFDLTPADERLGAFHAVDMTFPFGTVDVAGWGEFLGDVDRARAVSTDVRRAWSGFARTGDPGWPGYDLDRRATRIFAGPTEVVHDPRGALRTAWRSATSDGPIPTPEPAERA